MNHPESNVSPTGETEPAVMGQPEGQESAPATDKKTPQIGRMFVDLFLCLLIPTLILKKLSTPETLGPTWAFALAISLPLLVALYEFVREHRVGFVPALGFVSILLTGGIGLLQLPKEYIAIKEALIPGVLALATLLSSYTKYPLIKTFLYNDMIMDTERVASALEARNKTAEFDRTMVNATWMLAGSFVLSSALNFILAKAIIVSPTGTAEFNSELGTMNLMSYPVIVLPCMIVTMYALFYVIRNITRLTELKLEQIVHQ